MNKNVESQNTEISELKEKDEEIKNSIPKNVSELNNDSKYQTEDDLNQSQAKQDTKIEEIQKKDNNQDEKLEFLQRQNQALRDTLLNISSTVSGKGENVTLTGTAKALFAKLIVGGNSIQDGEPSPENVVDIINCGDNINLFNANGDFVNGYKNFYGKESINDSSIESSIFTHFPSNTRCKFYYSIKKGETITFSILDDISTTAYFFVAKADGAITSRSTSSKKYDTYTATEDCLLLIVTKKEDNKDYTDEEVENLKKHFKIEKGTKATQYSEYGYGNINVKVTDDGEQEQSKTFPLEKGQVLHINDYLADDGIHSKRETITFTGAENWRKHTVSSYENTFIYSPKGTMSKGLCTHYKALSPTEHNNKQDGTYFINSGSIRITDSRFTDIEEFKAYLSEEYKKGTPVICEVEYRDLPETITPYTKAQQKAYDEIMELTSYEDITHIVSEDEVSPIFDVTAYVKGTNIVQEQTIQSEPTSEPPSYDNQIETPSYEEDTEDEEVE